MTEIRIAAREAAGGVHRAEVDVRYLQQIYERVKGATLERRTVSFGSQFSALGYISINEH